MSKYILALIGFFFSFNTFAYYFIYKEEVCTDFLEDTFKIHRNSAVFIDSRNPFWREARDSHKEVLDTSFYIVSWGSYLECVKQEGEATETEIQRVQVDVNHLRQDYDGHEEQHQQIQAEEEQGEKIQVQGVAIYIKGCEDLVFFNNNNELEWLTKMENFCRVHQ